MIVFSIRRYLPVVALMLAIAIGPSGRGIAQSKSNSETALPNLTHANNQFAIEFYRSLSGSRKAQNVFASPASVSTALAMTFEGSSGNTRKEMADTLHLGMTDAERMEGFAQLMDAVKAAPGKHYQLAISNALWGQQSYAFVPEFTSRINRYYGGGFKTVDFVGARGKAVATINSWVEDKTAGKIKDLIHLDDVSELTRLILTNAIYFKGDWKQPFPEANTRPQDFHLDDGKIVKAQTMQQKSHFRYVHQDNVAAIELPYEGDDLSMIVLLPDAGVDSLESKLTADSLAAIEKAMSTAEVIVALPRFTFTARYSLAPELTGMGIRDAFSESAANFSGMTGDKDLYISAVIHQAFIDVNEKGSEAAAATAVIMSSKSVQIDMPEIFRADRPFLFLIKHKASGSILFIGRVANPNA